MGQELLKYLANVQPSGARDLYSPYSFLEWKNSRPSVLEKDLYIYYNRYVLEWFSKNKQKKVSNQFLLRQKYLFLLDQLQLFFTTEEKNQWYEKINLSDEKELLLGIPYFAKKLKKIALYYLKLRKKLKNVKIKYNSIGSVRGIEQEIYQHILENFTSSNEEIDPDIQNVLPTIDALKNQLVIKVEEIYDDGEYMDKSPTAPLSAFVDIFYEPTAKLFSTKGIVLSSEDWIFNTFTFPTSSTASSFVESLTSALFAEERSDAVLYDVYVQAFLGENKFNLTFPTATTTTETYDVNIQKGNNYFYYPTGTTDASIKFETPLPLIALSAANVGGTSSKQLSSSDTIFVKNGDEIKAAWLYFKDYDDENKDVLSLIKKDSTTSFIFPFPGYGLSAEDIVWTGPTLETEDEYAFLSPSLQASVNEAYWSQILPSDSTTELKLVETTLVDDGARASKNPTLADKVFIREERNPDTTTPRGSLSGAWLYRFERAALPISTIEEQNNVVMWPYFRTDEYVEQKEFLNYLTTSKVLTGSCAPVSVQSLDSSLFVAATSFDLADKIYKLESYDKSLATEATECCWLSSAEIIADNRKYFSQKGASFLFEPAVATKFVWTGPTMSVGEAFQGIDHMEDCPHAKNSKESWQTCTCKQIHYSPFGHSLETFEQGNRNADYVCLAPSTFSPDFDLNSWKDADNNTFKTSSQFAWYKTPSQWGNGVWSNANGNASTLQLSSGYVYVYHRAGSRTETENPSYAVLKKFYKNTSCFPSTNGSEPQLKWITAKRTEEGIWESANEESQMIFYPGDFVKFEKQQNTTWFYLSTSLIENETENKGSIWSVSDVIAFKSAADRTNINWPLIEEPFALENYDKQAPPISTFANISAIVAWKVSWDEDPTLVTVIESPYTYSSALSTNVYQNIFTFTFVPPQTGTYSIAVTAVDNSGNTFNIPNNDTKIPSISVIPQYREELIDTQFTTPQASILLEHPLSGWNYTVSDIGAKPFWAILNCEKSSATKSKGIREWGFENTFFGGYIPNVVPKMSPLTINYGDVVDYERNGRDFYWTQPVVYRTFSNTPQWCKLNYDTSSPSNLSAIFDSGLDDTLKVFPTLSASDIVLSNNINGAPVEIFYYALNSFLWTTSATTTNELSAPVPVPYYTTSFAGTNIANRFYPSVAVVPTLDRTYTIQDSGGYFTPQHLGASQYINTNFTATLKNLELTGTYITEDTSVHIGGRGLTYEQQPTLYDWEENNEWLKEPPTTDLLAGTVKKELTKSLQTFIPYQTPSPENSLGITRTDYQFTPWGGKYADQWVDKTNEPKGFTGVRNVSAWEASQELAKNNKEADYWITDIYGNQYGLFKSLSGVPVWQRPYINGELWVRTNGGTINPATKALSSVFDQFKQNNTIYNDLTSKQILAVDCFFDTLMIQTSGAFILSKITYDYDADAISLNTDDTRYKQLTTDKFEFEQTWFLPEEKTIVCLFTETSATSFYPILYTYNLNNSSFNKIFPTTQYNTLKTTLSSYSPKEGRFVYNSSTRTYGITYNAKDANDDIVFINLKLKRLEDLELETIDVYENRNPYRVNTMPPILLTQYLSAIPVAKNTTFTLEVSAYNNPTSYEIFQASSGVTELQVTSLGTFTGKLTSDGIHHINYSISNDVGSTYYALTLSAT